MIAISSSEFNQKPVLIEEKEQKEFDLTSESNHPGTEMRFNEITETNTFQSPALISPSNNILEQGKVKTKTKIVAKRETSNLDNSRGREK